jgi:tetratricopeptide (TPR) repeat protein
VQGAAGIALVLSPALVLVAGCVWGGHQASAIPSEIAKCRALTEQGTLALHGGQYAAAESRFRQALLANPADVDARRLFAEALWARGQTSASVAQMDVACQLAPHDTALVVRTGEMLLASGDVMQALARADAAIDDDPQSGPAWALRGEAKWMAGKRDEAIADLQRALAHAPGNQRVLLTLAWMYFEDNQPRRTLTTLHELLDLSPPGAEKREALVLEGRSYLALGRPADAAESLRLAALRGAPSAQTYYLLAQAERGQGRTDAAIRAAHQALAANSAHQESLRLLADLTATAERGGAGPRR